MASFAAIIYAILAALSAAFQIALANGAPWGILTLGGQFPGQLPRNMRLAALIQSAILFAMGGSVLAWAGFIGSWPLWTIWPTLAFTALTCLGNAVTPSRAERKIWLPVSGLMLLSALVVIAMA